MTDPNTTPLTIADVNAMTAEELVERADEIKRRGIVGDPATAASPAAAAAADAASMATGVDRIARAYATSQDGDA